MVFYILFLIKISNMPFFNPSPNFSINSKSKITLVLFLSFFQTVLAQTPDVLLAQLNANDYPEKIYIQYDKPAYFAGETIWFKAYLMEGLYPAAKSTVLAVELLNDSGRIIDKKTLPIRTGAAIGEFSLSPALLQGNYTVRAYTRRHMNSGAKRLYHHAFNIYNPLSPKQSLTTSVDADVVYFFPEAGNCIANISNTIAFRCSDKWGKPKELEGKVLDAKGNVITSFKSTHNGMGKFIFTPKPGEKYVAECLINSTEKKTVALPEMLSQGVSLQVNSMGGKTVFNVNASTVSIPALMPSYVLGVMENIVEFKIPVNEADRETLGTIPVENLPSGILQITVFNADNKPLAERLVFVNSGDYIPATTFKTDTLDFNKRQKNVFSFMLDEAAVGTYAVSVTAFNDDVNTEDNIVSRFLLTHDIKGFVYNPAYYFEKNDEQHAQQLDLVMLTNGWRRYNWSDVLSYTNQPAVFKDPGFVTFSATVFDPVKKTPLKNKALSIFVKTKDDYSDLLWIDTDSTGSLKMPDMIFEDTLNLSFTSATDKQEKLGLQINTQSLNNLFFLPKYDLPISGYRSINENSTYYKNNQDKIQLKYSPSGILLKEIMLITKAKSEKEKYEKKYTTGRLGSSATQEIDFITDPPKYGGNVLDYLRSRVAGVSISGGPFDYNINYRGARSLTGGQIPMAVFLDEFQVEVRDIATMPISQIAMVKVFSNALTSAGGALAIYTKREGDSKPLNSVKTDVLLQGFSPTKEFFSPNYDDGKTDNIAADERSTLYWNPYLSTTVQNSKPSFSFYNTDNAKQFKVVIEGVLKDGKLLHIERIVK